MIPRILICGQKPKRYDELERAYKGRARLLFFYEGNLHRLQDVARNVDRVFVTVLGIGHRASNALRKVADGRIEYVYGGGDSLRTALDSYLNITEGRPA